VGAEAIFNIRAIISSTFEGADLHEINRTLAINIRAEAQA